MRRREFVGLLGGAMAAMPLAARAQQPAKIPRIGHIVSGTRDSPAMRPSIEALRDGLRQIGYVDGRNIIFEYGEAFGQVDKFSTIVAEFLHYPVDIIVAPNSTAALVARQASATVPIVGYAIGDPVGDGLVTSLARPGGNVTGLTFLGPELTAKRLQLLKDVLPEVSRIGALLHPKAFSPRTTEDMLRTTADAARALGQQLHITKVNTPDEIDVALTALSKASVGAVLVFPSPVFFSQQQRMADAALRHRLPAIFISREFVQFGGFMAYGANIPDLARRSASHVDRIIRGANPGDLPVEQPTKFDLSINLKTAKALGIVVQNHIQQLADEIVE